MAADAWRMPARQAEFENLILNRRVEASAPFISREVWKACGSTVQDFPRDLPDRAQTPDASSRRVSLLKNISHSFSVLATQLEMLTDDEKHVTPSRSGVTLASFLDHHATTVLRCGCTAQYSHELPSGSVTLIAWGIMSG